MERIVLKEMVHNIFSDCFRYLHRYQDVMNAKSKGQSCNSKT